MLLRELFENLTINEVSMAPKNLAKLASTINAICGIEFELYYPADTGEGEEEPDWDADERPYTIRDVINFFANGDNSGHQLESLRERLVDEYDEYRDNQFYSAWEDKQEDLISDYILENDWDEDDEYQEAYASLKYTDEQIEICELIRKDALLQTDLKKGDYPRYEAARKIVKEKFDEKVETAVSLEYRDSNYENAYQEFADDFDGADEDDFLRYAGYTSMQDIMHQIGNLEWPYMISSEGDTDMDSIADTFESDTGHPAVGCDKYHGCDKYKGEMFVIERDGSLLEPETGYSGIEMVSPKLPLKDMVDTLQEVIKWANDKGCYTNSNCGLHMNVSLEGVAMANVDFVKLALFLGDDYILQQFDRIGNSYAKRSLQFIQDTIVGDPDKGYMALDALQQGLTSAAGKFIQSSTGYRQSSINMQDNRVEFRAPGNDWLSADVNKITNTLYRYVVALDIASDPDKYRDEYAKKLYSFLHTSSDDKRISKALSEFLSHSISEAELMNVIKVYTGIATKQTPDQYNKLLTNLNNQLKAGKITQTQYQQALGMKQSNMQQPQEKLPTAPLEWMVTGPNNIQGTFKAPTAVAAINQMRMQHKMNSARYPNSMFQVEPSYQTDIFNTFGGEEK